MDTKHHAFVKTHKTVEHHEWPLMQAMDFSEQ